MEEVFDKVRMIQPQPLYKKEVENAVRYLEDEKDLRLPSLEVVRHIAGGSLGSH